jgi:uncharacterized protein YjbJ (UPF0337 family)
LGSIARFAAFKVNRQFQRVRQSHVPADQEPSHPRNVFNSDGYEGDFAMDWNRVEGNWKQMKGQVKEKWGRLTDDDLDVIAGKRDQLEGKIQERYGQARDQVRKDIDDWYGIQKW